MYAVISASPFPFTLSLPGLLGTQHLSLGRLQKEEGHEHQSPLMCATHRTIHTPCRSQES